MKILHIIDSGGLYGAETMLLHLADEQVKLGLHPIICSIGEPNIPEKPLEVEAGKRGIQIKKTRMFPGPNMSGAMRILRYACHEHVDLLHSHGYKGNIFFGFIPKKLRKIPLVSTLHGWTHTDSFNRMKIYEWLDAKSLKYIDAVVVVNKNMLLHPRLKNENRIQTSVINNGIPSHNSTAAAHTLDQDIIHFCSQRFTIGSIGRLSKEKGFEYLIEAIHLLIKKGIHLKLVIIGEGDQRTALQKKITDLDLSGTIFLPGYREKAHHYLPFFNAFVLSSLTEGLPITLLEAMQAKIPVAATRVGGIPDVLKERCGGILTEPGKPEELAEALSHIYHNKQLVEQCVSFSYNEVMTTYSSKAMAQEYLDLYRKCTFLSPS